MGKDRNASGDAGRDASAVWDDVMDPAGRRARLMRLMRLTGHLLTAAGVTADAAGREAMADRLYQALAIATNTGTRLCAGPTPDGPASQAVAAGGVTAAWEAWWTGAPRPPVPDHQQDAMTASFRAAFLAGCGCVALAVERADPAAAHAVAAALAAEVRADGVNSLGVGVAMASYLIDGQIAPAG